MYTVHEYIVHLREYTSTLYSSTFGRVHRYIGARVHLVKVHGIGIRIHVGISTIRLEYMYRVQSGSTYVSLDQVLAKKLRNHRRAL